MIGALTFIRSRLITLIMWWQLLICTMWVRPVPSILPINWASLMSIWISRTKSWLLLHAGKPCAVATCSGGWIMNADNERYFSDLIEAKNLMDIRWSVENTGRSPQSKKSSWSGDLFSWPTASWPIDWTWTNAPSASGNPARPVWCSPPGAVCAGWPDWVCRSITLSVAEDSLPDAS